MSYTKNTSLQRTFIKICETVGCLDTTIRCQHYQDSLITTSTYKNDLPPPLNIKGILGKGGMGTVFLAQQHFPHREIALKRVITESHEDKMALFTEGMLMGLLEHPNIIPIYGVNTKGEDAPEVWMKKVKGVTFRQALEKGDFSGQRLKKAIQAMISICHALEYAHSKKIIHRDVKLENIMLGEFGSVYLLDWGIALQKEKMNLETENKIIGTINYMAPEMLLGKTEFITEQTDIFLLGASLHEIVTGKPRHTEVTFKKLMREIEISAPFDYRALNAQQIGEIINKACAPKPQDRYRSVKEVRLALESYLEQQQARKIEKAAEEELQNLKRFSQEQLTAEKRLAMHEAFQRARFGFEQALNISSKSKTARIGLDEALSEMIKHKIKESDLDAAEVLIKSLSSGSAEHLQMLRAQQQKQQHENKEINRLKEIGLQYDPKTSRKQRRDIIILTLCIIVFILIFLFPISKVDPDHIPPDVLFLHSVVYLIPTVLLLFSQRQNILKNPNSRRFFFGIFGAAFALFLHRWIAVENHLPTRSIIVTDFFILALGFLNMLPRIQTGISLALFCTGIGVLNQLYPATIWFGTIAFTIMVPIILLLDWRAERL
ncbi:MAG: hypothetical protein CL916_15455 [Deltaproteobacteria bacterium]|nr:hypothetical protein [Deltaproteobacteria bacterium]